MRWDEIGKQAHSQRVAVIFSWYFSLSLLFYLLEFRIMKNKIHYVTYILYQQENLAKSGMCIYLLSIYKLQKNKREKILKYERVKVDDTKNFHLANYAIIGRRRYQVHIVPQKFLMFTFLPEHYKLYFYSSFPACINVILTQQLEQQLVVPYK